MLMHYCIIWQLLANSIFAEFFDSKSNRLVTSSLFSKILKPLESLVLFIVENIGTDIAFALVSKHTIEVTITV